MANRKIVFRKQSIPKNFHHKKLTPDMVRHIRVLYHNYKRNQTEITEWLLNTYGIKLQRTAISHIITGKRWKSVV